MMRRTAIVLLAGLLAPAAWAAGGGQTPFDFQPNLGNQASLQRGAASFMNYCAGCHSLQYLRYQRLSTDLGIPEDIVEDNLIFSDAQLHDHIRTGLPERSSKWFGQPPPDLTLVTRSRGADWVYSFLLSFYLDDSTANGINNLVLPNTAMPHVLAPLQGYQELVHEAQGSGGGHGSGAPNFELVQEGRLSPAEYRRTVADITNFLVYAGEPAKMVRYGLGVKVIAFLLLFTVLAWLLKREYWRDVH